MEKLSESSFRQLLKERGLKSTHQRDVIVQMLGPLEHLAAQLVCVIQRPVNRMHHKMVVSGSSLPRPGLQATSCDRHSSRRRTVSSPFCQTRRPPPASCPATATVWTSHPVFPSPAIQDNTVLIDRAFPPSRSSLRRPGPFAARCSNLAQAKRQTPPATHTAGTRPYHA